MTYCLADYILTISVPESLRTALGLTTISIGGEGSYLDSFSFSLNTNTWQTIGDSTGSWIHTKSLDRTGICSITLNMLSTQVTQLTRLFNIYFLSDIIDEGVTITLSNAESNIVATCVDCFVSKIPDVSIENQPRTRIWQFTCGQIIIH